MSDVHYRCHLWTQLLGASKAGFDSSTPPHRITAFVDIGLTVMGCLGLAIREIYGQLPWIFYWNKANSSKADQKVLAIS